MLCWPVRVLGQALCFVPCLRNVWILRSIVMPCIFTMPGTVQGSGVLDVGWQAIAAGVFVLGQHMLPAASFLQT